MNTPPTRKNDRIENALADLYRRHSAGIKFDLDTMNALLGRLGDPHRRLAAIHVAGTNGKGSVCAMIESVLRARGLRPALYTSPHLLRFNERIRVDGREIDDRELAALIESVAGADREAAAAPGGRPATFFEFATAMAFEHFRRARAGIAVIETGMGGRLDATNVLTPAVTVITRIGLDHAEWLGRSIEAVAAEKAGIIKAGRPVVAGAMPDAAMNIIAAVAAERGAPLVAAEEQVAIRALRGRGGPSGRLAVTGALMDYGAVTSALGGGYQIENLATAVTALETFSRVSGIEFDPGVLGGGLSSVRWPARMQRIGERPPVLLDGAHNPDGARALVKSLGAWKRRPVALVTGVCADKDYRAMLRVFHGIASRCWTVAHSSPRSLPAVRLAAAARQTGMRDVSAAELPEAIAAATRWALERNGLVLIAGSLFLAADVLELRTRTSSGTHDLPEK